MSDSIIITERIYMASLYIDWVGFDIKDPHPAALVNIQRAVDHMVNVGATNKYAPISIYAIAKATGKQQKQMMQLLRDRPGFVKVESNGKSRGYYYDAKNFGMKYPAVYGILRTRHDLLAVEDIETSVREEVGETAQEFNQRFPEMSKQLAKQAVAANVQYAIPEWEGFPNELITVTFPYLPDVALNAEAVNLALDESKEQQTISENLSTVVLNLMYRKAKNG